MNNGAAFDNDNTELLNRVYDEYFGASEEIDQVKAPHPVSDLKDYTYKALNNNTNVESTADIPGSNKDRWLAEDNIDDVDELAEHIRLVLNAAWGDNWGEFGPELKEGDDSESIKLPQITYDVVTRIIPDKKPLKPILMDTIKEVVNGRQTGDYYNLYRQWFDSVIEFNICGSNSLECRKLMKKFETILATYTGHLKKSGASEILFLKEIHATQSSNYRQEIPMKCLMYLVRIERITIIKGSTIKNMEIALSTKNDAGEKSASKTYKI